MNEEIKAQWVAALRSGEYKQAVGTLRDERRDGSVGFCCLGVLCDLAAKAGVVELETHISNVTGSLISSYDHATQCLPDVVSEWADIHSGGDFEDVITEDDPDDPAGERVLYADSLWQLNDHLRWSFEQIADLIEERF